MTDEVDHDADALRAAADEQARLEALGWGREPGTGRATAAVAAAYVLALLALVTGGWILFGPLGMGAGFVAGQRGDARGGAAMVTAGVAMLVGAIVANLL